jgi:hypothetical protein
MPPQKKFAQISWRACAHQLALKAVVVALAAAVLAVVAMRLPAGQIRW